LSDDTSNQKKKSANQTNYFNPIPTKAGDIFLNNSRNNKNTAIKFSDN